MSNKLVSVRSGIPDQRTTLSLEDTHLSAVSANSIQHRPSSDSKKVRYPIHKSPHMVPNPRQMLALYTVPAYLFKIHFNILPSTFRLSKLSVPLSFSTKTLYAFLVSHIRATCSAHLIFLVLITIIMNVEGYKF
jgi:hypothetical protein